MTTLGTFGAAKVTMTSGKSLSTHLRISSWKGYAIKIPSMPSGTELRFKVCNDVDGDYYPLYHAPTVATALPTVVNIGSAVCNCIVNLPPIPAEYLWIHLVTAPSETCSTFEVLFYS
jgi:hypothetical protein